jgi:hypothetical protein
LAAASRRLNGSFRRPVATAAALLANFSPYEIVDGLAEPQLSLVLAIVALQWADH